MTKKLVDDALIEKLTNNFEITVKELKRPSMNMWACSVGATFVFVKITWTTLLEKGSLSVHIGNPDIASGNPDIASQFTIDESAMNATATVDSGVVGVVLIQASGKFRTPFSHRRAIQLSASTAVYIPS